MALHMVRDIISSIAIVPVTSLWFSQFQHIVLVTSAIVLIITEATIYHAEPVINLLRALPTICTELTVLHYLIARTFLCLLTFCA